MHDLEGTVEVWLARAEEAGEPSALARCRAILQPGELAAAAAFHKEQDRRRALLARALLRETLSRHAPVAPADWRFAPGAHGKPAIATPTGSRLSFNLSHSRGLIACALTQDCEIGVDVEDCARALDPLELAGRVCAPDELAQLLELRGDARQRRFFELWTLKEAYLKARGLGFALEPQCVRFDLREPGRVRAELGPETGDDAARWWFALPDCAPGYALALAVASGGRPFEIRTFPAHPGSSTA